MEKTHFWERKEKTQPFVWQIGLLVLVLVYSWFQSITEAWLVGFVFHIVF